MPRVAILEKDTPVTYLHPRMGELYAGPGFRTCSHSGCQWPAVASLGFDYASRRAWIDELPPRPQPSTYDLCAVHAGRFKPPQGWETEDRRSLPEPLFHPRERPESSESEAQPSPQLRALEGNLQATASAHPGRRSGDRVSAVGEEKGPADTAATQAGLPEV